MIGHCALAFSMAIGARAARTVTKGGEPVEATIEGVAILNNRVGLDDFIVTFEEGCTDDSIAKFCDGQCPLFGHPGSGGVAWASVRGKATLENLLKRRGDVKVQSVEPDEEMKSPDDELEGAVDDDFGVQNTPWGIRRVGGNRPNAGGRGAHIYVHDTGIRVSHGDFGGRAATSIDTTGGTLRQCRGNPNCAADRNGHGTHCAGTAGGRVYGVASSALLYAVKVLNDQGTMQSSWNFGAIDWVGQNGRRPAVMSMSLGGRGAAGGTYEQVLAAATRAGVVIVTASGNSNANGCGFAPGNSPSTINVGSTDQRDRRSGFSNWGNCVDIMAPGTAVASAGHTSNSAVTTMGGTSMACPHVSGGAALIMGRNPSSTPTAVWNSLSRSAQTNAISDLRGSGNRFFQVA